MSDPNPSSPKNQVVPPTTDAAIKSAPAQGYALIDYRVLDQILQQHTTLLRTYLALVTLGNTTTNDILAEVTRKAAGGDYSHYQVGECRAAVQKLRELGFVKVISRAGKPDEYYLMPPKAGPAVPVIESQREEVVVQAAKVILDAEEIPDPTVPEEPQTLVGVSPDLPGIHPDSLSPWWRGHQQYLKFLHALVAQYPKQTKIEWALEAFEATFADGPDVTKDEQMEIWNGLQDWLAYWKEENTEDKYIPAFGNWIKKEKWREDMVRLRANSRNRGR